MRRLSTPELSLRHTVLAFGLAASVAIAGCSKDASTVGESDASAGVTTESVTATINFNGVNSDPTLCQPTSDGSFPGYRPCFLPVRPAVGGTSETNPVLNKPDRTLPDGSVTASWPYEKFDGPDDSQPGDTVTVVCTETIKVTEPGKVDEAFAGIETTEDHLNLSAAPNLQIAVRGGKLLVYARQKWLVEQQGSFDQLPSCADYLASAS